MTSKDKDLNSLDEERLLAENGKDANVTKKLSKMKKKKKSYRDSDKPESSKSRSEREKKRAADGDQFV